MHLNSVLKCIISVLKCVELSPEMHHETSQDPHKKLHQTRKLQAPKTPINRDYQEQGSLRTIYILQKKEQLAQLDADHVRAQHKKETDAMR